MQKNKNKKNSRDARIRKLRARAKLRERETLAARHSVRRFRVYIDRNGQRARGWAEARYAMPEVFCLDENYHDTARAIAAVRVAMTAGIERFLTARYGARRSNRLASFFDLSTVRRCSPGAALVLASEYDRAKALVKGPIPIVNIRQWNSDVRRLLQDVGFFKLLEIVVPHVESSGPSSVRMVPFASGELVGNEEAGSLITTLGDMVVAADPGAIDDPTRLIRRLRLFEALVEATENAIHHAYPEELDDRSIVRRWWMTGAVDAEEKRITIVVYDQGVSIPGSLPGWEGNGWIEKGLRRLLGHIPASDDPAYDPHRLRLAMAKPRSSTGKNERGKGLPLLKAVVSHCDHGRIRVLSRGGEFIQDKGGVGRAQSLQPPMTGTLVEWDLWL